MLRTFNRKIPHWELSIDCREKPITILESAQNFASPAQNFAPPAQNFSPSAPNFTPRAQNFAQTAQNFAPQPLPVRAVAPKSNGKNNKCENCRRDGTLRCSHCLLCCLPDHRAAQCHLNQ